MPLLYFVRSPFTYGFKATDVSHDSFIETFSDYFHAIVFSKRSAFLRFFNEKGGGG